MRTDQSITIPDAMLLVISGLVVILRWKVGSETSCVEFVGSFFKQTTKRTRDLSK